MPKQPPLASQLGCWMFALWVPAAVALPLFEDVSDAVGLDFVHFNGMSGEFYFVEMTGQGGALFDYDNDGDLDIYLVQGAMLGAGKGLSDALFPALSTPLQDHLLRNDLGHDAAGRPKPRLVDVTEASGIRLDGYGMGVASGDYDNDGWVDLYVTHYGANRLLRNRGDGTFVDVTGQTGTGGAEVWSTSAAFFDYDRDGWLDLYVVNYVDYSVDENKKCYAQSSRRDYCGPAAFKPLHDRLYRNLENGSFREVSDAVLADYRPGPGLGVVSADFNGDGWLDLYVANDGAANQLWINQGGTRFLDDALFSGAAVNRGGRAEASMGVDAGDFDNDGDEDLFVTHLMGETNTLYVNDGAGIFEDQTVRYGLAGGSFPYTAFGTGWLDYDNDSWLDLLILNGAVQSIPDLRDAGDLYPLDQPNQLFRNEAGTRFVEIEEGPDSPLSLTEVSRGAAFGDVDNDGDTDVLVFNNNGRARLLLNRVGQDRPWIGLRPLDPTGRVDRLGARVRVLLPGGKAVWRRSGTDRSYCTANDPRVLLGLPAGLQGVDAEILWPDGSAQTLRGLPLGRYTEVRQAGPDPHQEEESP